MKHWYTDGINERQCEETQVPENWVRGRSKITIEKQIKTEMSKDPVTRKEQYNKRAETNKRAQHKRTPEARQKMSDAKKNGFVPWNKGLTKTTDERMAKLAHNVSKTNLKKCETLKNNDPQYFQKWRNFVRQKMKENNLYQNSKPEDEYYEQLICEYGEDNVIRQYYCDRYPFNCDFYIPSEDLFIEINYHPSHGPHPFNQNDQDDINEKNRLLTENTKWSKMILYVWTELDVKKLDYATKNNLNYKVIYKNNN